MTCDYVTSNFGESGSDFYWVDVWIWATDADLRKSVFLADTS